MLTLDDIKEKIYPDVIYILERIIINNNECWEWQKTLTKDGYAVLHYKGKRYRCHRATYEMFIGPIPEGLQIDHLCRNRKCVNPNHLEPVTSRENTLRGNAILLRRSKTNCKRGHKLAGNNLLKEYLRKGIRACRQCKVEHTRNYRLKNKAALFVAQPQGGQK